ncbi:uncharacterized protein LOC111246264 isoform X2 [Varroa destructor]|uniref:Uncharacterized protein n=1 Tax=Varroa destructor TaxID=109461 RepID=A0A7M7JRI8_VARDE|nr:uncharacterized protein LOC111246264 isoform X2 [Varroa destructor]
MCFEKYESSTKMYRICDHFSNEHNIYKYRKKIINAKLLSQWRTFVLAVRSSKAGEAQLKQTLWNKLIGLMTHADGCIAEKKGDPNN